MSTEKDVSRDAKKTVIIIVSVIFCLMTGGFLLVSWLNTPPPAISKINVDKAAGGAGKPTQESMQYRKILRDNNAEGARQAQASNDSFIASVGTDHDILPLPTEDKKPPPSFPAIPQSYVAPPEAMIPAVDPDKKKALEALIKELVTQRHPPAGQLASVAGVSSAQSGMEGKQNNPYAGWIESLAPVRAQNTSATAPSAPADRVVIPAGSRTGALIDTEVDSDNTNAQVLAHIPTGPYAGATLIANDVKLAGNGVSIHFTTMSWQKDSWRVDVWAAMPDSLQTSVASEVNNRYATRILLPAIAHGLGLGGQLYASANTKIMSNGLNTMEGRVGMPDGKAVAGTILGGTAQQAGQVIASDAQKLPAKQVLVYRGQSIAVLFMSAVKESDRATRTPPESMQPDMRPQPASDFTPAIHP